MSNMYGKKKKKKKKIDIRKMILSFFFSFLLMILILFPTTSFFHKECADGFYGLGCSGTCDHCLNNACDKVDGHCELCPPGYHGLYCNESMYSFCT